jgi:hypothetical protein
MALMQLIPITKAYREGYEGIRWDVDDWGVVKAVPERVRGKAASILYSKSLRDDPTCPASGLSQIMKDVPLDKIPGMPAARYWGC